MHPNKFIWWIIKLFISFSPLQISLSVWLSVTISVKNTYISFIKFPSMKSIDWNKWYRLLFYDDRTYIFIMHVYVVPKSFEYYRSSFLLLTLLCHANQTFPQPILCCFFQALLLPSYYSLKQIKIFESVLNISHALSIHFEWKIVDTYLA